MSVRRYEIYEYDFKIISVVLFWDFTEISRLLISMCLARILKLLVRDFSLRVPLRLLPLSWTFLNSHLHSRGR